MYKLIRLSDVLALLPTDDTVGPKPSALRAAVEALPGVIEQNWIPVVERMPELVPCNAGTAYSEAVIVWTSGRKAMVAVWDGIDFICAARFWDAEGEEITHWMPISVPKMGGVE